MKTLSPIRASIDPISVYANLSERHLLLYDPTCAGDAFLTWEYVPERWLDRREQGVLEIRATRKTLQCLERTGQVY